MTVNELYQDMLQSEYNRGLPELQDTYDNVVVSDKGPI